jgi:hypothetical protein
VEAYCLDFHKSNPAPSDTYTIAEPDKRAKAICEAGKRKGLSMQIIQVALWLDRREGSVDAIKARFSASDGDIAAARALLEGIGDGVKPTESGSEQNARPSVPVEPASKVQAPSSSADSLPLDDIVLVL